MLHYPDFSRAHIMVVGDIILDRYYWGEVDRISPEAPIPVVKVTHKTQRLGGAGNVAMNLCGLKCAVFLLAVCGEDNHVNYLTKIINKEGIDYQLIIDPNQPTTTKTRIIGQGQQLLRLDEEISITISPKIEAKLFSQFKIHLQKTDAVILSDYGKGIFNGDFAQKIIMHCKLNKVPVFVDPKGNSWKRYNGADCITPNEAELFLVAPFDRQSNNDLAAKAHKTIIDYKLTHLLVTRGAKGMSLFNLNQDSIHIQTKAQEVFDVSGAGDTVIATIAASRACNLSMEAAARLANTAAGVVVGKLGTHAISALEFKQALIGKNVTGTDKIVGHDQASEISDRWRNEGKKIVFTNGCFDILHVGHMKVLRTASDQGDKLIVGLNSDASVTRLKGESRPVISEAERAALLSNIESVDMVVLFDEDTPLELIKRIRPDILVKGGDWSCHSVVGRSEVESWGGRVHIVSVLEGVSTTNVIKKMNSN
jgi:D-beta-D-heptose 7-phosphate kinase/D-beta-D-heptose 1-phosphate adenosyltransferase